MPPTQAAQVIQMTHPKPVYPALPGPSGGNHSKALGHIFPSLALACD